MLATALWLFTITAGTVEKSATLGLGMFLVVVALAAWIWGEFVQRGTSRRPLAMAVCVLLVGIGAFLAYPRSGERIQWEPWTVAAVAKAQAEGRPVLVDFTADWCLTCKANNKIAIEIPSVRSKLREIRAVPLLGDYTHLPDEITAELNRHGRAGVPLVLVYSSKTGAVPEVLPEVLTPGVVLDALARAAGEKFD
jgi:thiol:disulfide interchange protein